ncbi:MAG: hypothetical protein ACYTG5_03845 [Planctomycetota bacterium]|jgi:type II secretory pathway pseudopilin PulG
MTNLAKQAGTTLVEILIVVVILVSLVIVTTGLVISTSDAQRFSERTKRANELNQEILNDIRNELMSAVNLFCTDNFGPAYDAILDHSSAAPPIGSSAQATMNPTGIIEQEATSGSLTGNSLLLARQEFTTEFQCVSTNVYRVDVYRLIEYYLTPADGGPSPGTPYGLNLAKYVSEPLADAAQIDAILDPTDQAEVLAHLRTGSTNVFGETIEPVQLVWERGADPAVTGTLRQILSTNLLSDTPQEGRANPWAIELDAARASDGLLFYRRFSVVTNEAIAALGVGRFALRDTSGDGFPHGFEVQIAGTAASKRVLLHSSIVAIDRGTLPAHSDLWATVFLKGM